MRGFAAIVGIAALAGCGGDNAILGETYAMQPGTWEVRAWMENNQSPGTKIEEQVLNQELSPQAAQGPVASIVFGQFYNGSSPEHIQADAGRISGYLEQRAVAPYQAHQQPVTGSYTDDSFKVVIEIPVAPGVSQVVEGRLVEPLG